MQVKMIILLINLAKRRTKNSKIAQTKIMHLKTFVAWRAKHNCIDKKKNTLAWLKLRSSEYENALMTITPRSQDFLTEKFNHWKGIEYV